MSENLPNIDDLFKKALDQLNDSPSQQVWDNVDKELNKKRVVSLNQKYRRWKWIAAACLIFSVGMATYVVGIRIEQTNVARQKTHSGKSQKTYGNEVAVKPAAQVKPKTSASNSSEVNQASAETSTAKTDTQQNERAVATTEKIKSEQKAQKIKKQNLDAAINQQSQIENKAIAGTKRTNGISTPSTANDLNKRKIYSSAIASATHKTGKQPFAASKAVERTTEDEYGFIPRYYVDATIVKPKNNDFSLGYATTIEGPKAETMPSQSKAEVKSILAGNGKHLGLNKKHFGATLYMSRDFTWDRLAKDHPRFREDERNEIRKNEKVISSYTKGLLVNYNLGRNWIVESGINVSKRVTDFQPKNIYARQGSGGNVNFHFSCSAGFTNIPVKSGGQPPVPGDSIRSIAAQNTLKYTGIPLNFRYNISAGKFSLQPGIGVTANFLALSRIETTLVTPTGKEQASTNSINGLKENYWSGTASVKASYNISNTFAVTFLPTVRVGLTSINKEGPVKANYNSVGLGLGLSAGF